MDKQFQLQNDIRNLEFYRSNLELLINATPSGQDRNNLCDANIYLDACIMLMKDVVDNITMTKMTGVTTTGPYGNMDKPKVIIADIPGVTSVDPNDPDPV